MADRASKAFLAVLAVLATADAQCLRPALPDNTQNVPDQPATCDDDATMGDGETCSVQCIVGTAQDAAGTYAWTCTGTEFSAEPAPECTPCAIGTYNAVAGAAACLDCPAESTTPELGADAVTECLCNPGHTGIIETPDSVCAACDIAEYKATTGPEACTTCPALSTTAATASTVVTQCLCTAGHTGEIVAPDSECIACPIAFYKGTLGIAACDSCPDAATTEAEASTLVTECLCTAGHTGDIAVPEDVCDACELNTWKSEIGPEVCSGCPTNSITTEEGATEVSACECDTANGWTGDIETEEDDCVEEESSGLSTGAIVGITAAGVAGLAATAGGIAYGGCCGGAGSINARAPLLGGA